MRAQHKTYSAEFKGKVAVKAIRGFHTINELAAQYEVHPNQISMWKAQLLQAVPGVFSGRGDQKEKEGEELRVQLYQQIGQLKVELDGLKKNRTSRLMEKEH